MTIKAIETVYNGYRFRSRLEARWAVFFDALGIKYDYEPEGFDLGELGWYLPDFYLSGLKYYVEIKPGPLNDEEQAKLNALNDRAPEGTYGAVAFSGTPDYPHWQWGEADGERRLIGWENSTGLLAMMLVTEGIVNHPHMDTLRRLAEWFESWPFDRPIWAARQARFEHGEQSVTAAMLEAV